MTTGYHRKMADAEHEHLIWKDRGSSLEIRFRGELDDGRPALSELLGTGSNVRLEQVNHENWTISVMTAGKKFLLVFSVNDGRLWVRLSDMDDDSAWWHGDNRPEPLPGERD